MPPRPHRSAEALLTLDRGNSNLDCMRWEGEAGERRRLDPGEPRALAALLDPPPAAAVALSVVAGGLRAAAELLAEHGVPLSVAGEDLACPLELRYPDPASLGADRWVAALAAHREFGAAVVVDCGTAVTVDLVTADGVFLGGTIAPGAGAMAQGLRARAPGLPAADLGRPLRLVPVTSADAVDAGLQLGFCGAVDRLVEEVARAGGLADAARVLTGGEAELYRRHGRIGFVHVPDLVHRGLRRLWRESRG